MPHPQKAIPSYFHLKPTDQAYVRVPNGSGARRLIYLGRYNSPESQAEYGRIIASLSISLVTKVADQATVGGSNVTVDDLLLFYVEWAEKNRQIIEARAYRWNSPAVRTPHGA
jgi:hypothetical protein